MILILMDNLTGARNVARAMNINPNTFTDNRRHIYIHVVSWRSPQKLCGLLPDLIITELWSYEKRGMDEWLHMVSARTTVMEIGNMRM